VKPSDVTAYIIGIIGIILTVYFYFRAKEKPLPSYAIVKNVLIHPRQAQFSEKLQIRYDGNVVPSVLKVVAFFWNRGRKTLDRNDIVPSDPIRLHFTGGPTSKILDVRSPWTTRDAVGAKISRQENENSIELSFEFLDQGDGFALEVLYSGDDSTEIVLTGTVKGVPKGVERLYVSPSPYGRSWYEDNTLTVLDILFVILGTIFWGVLGFITIVAIHQSAPKDLSHVSSIARFFYNINPIYGAIAGIALFLARKASAYSSNQKSIPTALRKKYSS